MLPVLVALGLWAVGMIPVFDGARWIPITVVTASGLVVIYYLMLKFGVWRTYTIGTRDYGEEYMKTFSPGVGFGLGWLRWFMQLVMCCGIFVAMWLTWADARWWWLFGTAETRALPERAAAMPVPADWQVTYREQKSDHDNSHPNSTIDRRFDVPVGYTFQDMKTWLVSSRWEVGPDERSPGDLVLEYCRPESGRCWARMIPEPGRHPEYFVDADYDPALDAGDHPEVRLRLTYREYVEPEWEVSEETVNRAALIPIPAGWIRLDADATVTQNGEEFDARYRVPETFTRQDLEDWMTGSTWTDPPSGQSFGDIRLTRPCGESHSGDYLCSAIVTATERTGPTAPGDGPIESVTASLEGNHTVRVSFERNG